MSNSQGAAGIPSDGMDKLTLEARKAGVFAGLTSGLASAIISSRLFGLKRNVSLFSGVLAGVLSGYLFTQAFKDSATGKLRTEARAKDLVSEAQHQTSPS